MDGFFLIVLISTGWYAIATQPGGAASPEFDQSVKVAFEAEDIEASVAGREVLISEDSVVFDMPVDGVCR